VRLARLDTIVNIDVGLARLERGHKISLTVVRTLMTP